MYYVTYCRVTVVIISMQLVIYSMLFGSYDREQQSQLAARWVFVKRIHWICALRRPCCCWSWPAAHSFLHTRKVLLWFFIRKCHHSTQHVRSSSQWGSGGAGGGRGWWNAFHIRTFQPRGTTAVFAFRGEVCRHLIYHSQAALHMMNEC